MKNILLSTTNTIQGSEIVKYIDLVFSNVVIGTNVFSDIGASFTDFFGGTSGIYKGKLEKMRDIAISEVKNKTFNLGGNAIIGLRVDFDEISGKGKSMFMVSISGTAVKIEHKELVSEDVTNDSVISNERLIGQLTKENILFRLDKNKLPTSNQWESLISNPDFEVTTKLFPFYLAHLDYSEIERDVQLLANFDILLKRLDTDLVSDFLYNTLLTSEQDQSNLIVGIINSHNLFDPKRVLNLIEKKKIKEAALCLTATKDYYNTEDLVLMRQILEKINQLPDTGKIETVKSGLLGKEKEKYICENTHHNDVDLKFCQTCKINIKGLTMEDLSRVSSFSRKIKSLEYLFENN